MWRVTHPFLQSPVSQIVIPPCSSPSTSQSVDLICMEIIWTPTLTVLAACFQLDCRGDLYAGNEHNNPTHHWFVQFQKGFRGSHWLMFKAQLKTSSSNLMSGHLSCSHGSLKKEHYKALLLCTFFAYRDSLPNVDLIQLFRHPTLERC